MLLRCFRCGLSEPYCATIWCQGGYREGRSDWAMGRWQLLSMCELFEVSWGFRVTIASSSRTWALLLLFSHSCFGKMHLYGQRKHHTRLILWRMQWHLPDICLVNLFWTFRGRMWRIGSGVLGVALHQHGQPIAILQSCLSTTHHKFPSYEKKLIGLVKKLFGIRGIISGVILSSFVLIIIAWSSY